MKLKIMSAKRFVLFPYLVRRGIENYSALGGSKEEVVSITNEIARRRTDIFS